MRNPSKKAQAYHEASHAVMAYLRGRRFRYVTIEPDKNEGSLGRVEFYDYKMIRSILEETHCNIFLMEHPEVAKEIVWRDVLCTMAGQVAQDMGVPGSVVVEQYEGDPDT